MSTVNKKTLKNYRSLISDAWLPLVRRRRLKSQEYDLIKAWFNSELPVEYVLKAIQMCAERARINDYTIFSLGVIKADLETIRRKQARSQVGTQRVWDWREQWEFDLREIRESATDATARSMLDRLIEDLPRFKEERAARERFGEISKFI